LRPAALLTAGRVEQYERRSGFDVVLVGELLIHFGSHIQPEDLPGLPSFADAADRSDLPDSAEAEVGVNLDEDRLARRLNGMFNRLDVPEL
jgi:hypothetical protein